MNTSDKLREQIAKEIGEWRWKDSFYGEYVTENDRNSCRVEAGLVLDLIKEWLKEAGYILPEQLTVWDICGKVNYVKLAEDQSLPSESLGTMASSMDDSCNYEKYPDKETQQDMLKAGWRKVER